MRMKNTKEPGTPFTERYKLQHDPI